MGCTPANTLLLSTGYGGPLALHYQSSQGGVLLTALRYRSSCLEKALLITESLIHPYTKMYTVNVFSKKKKLVVWGLA